MLPLITLPKLTFTFVDVIYENENTEPFNLLIRVSRAIAEDAGGTSHITPILKCSSPRLPEELEKQMRGKLVAFFAAAPSLDHP